MIAIRATGLGRYFGPQLNLGRVTAASVWSHFRGIMGAPSKFEHDGIQRGLVVRGHVLKDVSFEIEKGSVVCLTGSPESVNTLLRILAGTIAPTEGRAEIYGRVSALIEAGENLEPLLTARQNIEAQIKLKKIAPADAERYARDVIAFAGLEEFEHIMVRRYSTGMTMRLSVAMALQDNPDILLLEDMLEVGDIEFQQRCVERFQDMKKQGCTMLLSINDENLLRQLATRVITLGEGGVFIDNSPRQFFLGQQDFVAADVTWHLGPGHPENDAAALRGISVSDIPGSYGIELDIDMDFDIKLEQRCRPIIDVLCGKTRVLRSIYPSYIDIARPQPLRLRVRLPASMLSEGTYIVVVSLASLHQENHYALKHNSAITLEVKPGASVPAGPATLPLIRPKLGWKIENLAEAAE